MHTRAPHRQPRPNSLVPNRLFGLQPGNETAPINTVRRKPHLISGRFDLEFGGEYSMLCAESAAVRNSPAATCFRVMTEEDSEGEEVIIVKVSPAPRPNAKQR